jgi:hypothetical protein
LPPGLQPSLDALADREYGLFAVLDGAFDRVELLGDLRARPYIVDHLVWHRRASGV